MKTLVLASYKGIDLSDFFSGFRAEKLWVMGASRGVQLNFFPFFPLAGSVTRPRVSYIEVDSSPLSTVPSYCCSAPEIRTVYSRPAYEESRAKLVLFFVYILSTHTTRVLGQSVAWFHGIILPVFFDRLWYFVEAQPGMIFFFYDTFIKLFRIY